MIQHIATNFALLGNCDGGVTPTMLFREKVGLLMHELGVSNAALSRAGELDVSLISRFRSGERVPSRFSPQLDRLAMGAAALGVQLGLCERLCAICGCPYCEDQKALYDAINAWINAEDSGLKPQRAHKTARRAVDQRSFTNMLDTLMTAARVTNEQLGQALQTDAHIISRYRTGKRQSDIGSRLISGICTYFSKLELAPKPRAALFDALGIAPTQNPDVVYVALREALLPRVEENEPLLVENMLSRLDEHTDMHRNIESRAFVHLEGHYSQAVAYYAGISGIRCAVKKLLEAALKDTSVKDLAFYSDHPADLLLGDPEYAAAITADLMCLVNRGVCIRLIHDVNRKSMDLLGMLEAFLPLFLSGNVKTYFCKRPRDARFQFFMLIAGRAAAVRSSNVTAAMPIAHHVYTEDPALVSNARSQFAALLLECAHLADISIPRNMDEYVRQLAQFERSTGDLEVLLNSLSLYTMPPTLLKRILSRAGLDNAQSRKLMDYHALSVQRMRRKLALYNITDYIFIPTHTQLKEGLVRVPLTGLFGSPTVFYTPEEYAEHFNATLHLMRQNLRYNVYALSERPYSGLTVGIRQGGGVYIRKAQEPQATFFFEHAGMYGSFSRFFETLRHKAFNMRTQGAQASQVLKQLGI